MSVATIFRPLACLILVLALRFDAHAAASGAGEILEKDVPISVREVAPGLYFQYHHQESNSAFFVTDEGNYYRMNLFVSSYYHFLKTGRPEIPYP